MNRMTLKNGFHACLVAGLLLAGTWPAYGAAAQVDAKVSAKLTAIQKEAFGLSKQARTASPAELKKIDQRAGELLNQLRTLGLPIPKRISPAMKKGMVPKATAERAPKVKKKAAQAKAGKLLKPGSSKKAVRPLAPKTAKARPSIMKIAPAKLVVKSIAHWPVRLKAGKAIKLEIKFKNKGPGKSPSTAQYKISCTVLSGGGPNKRCPVPSKTSSLNKSLAPGEIYSVKVPGPGISIIQPLPQAGRYRVSVSVLMPNQRGRPRPSSITLNVAPVIKLKAIPPPIKLKKGGSDKEGSKPKIQRVPSSAPKKEEEDRRQFRLRPR